MKKTLIILSILALSACLAHESGAETTRDLPHSRFVERLVPVPQEFQHRWTMIDCKTGVTSYRFSKYFMVRSGSGGSQLTRTGGLREAGIGHYRLLKGRMATLLALSKKGELIEYYTAEGTPVSLEDIENNIVIAAATPFQSCDNTNSEVVKEDPVTVSILAGLDRVHESCPGRTDIYKTECQEAVWEMFDADQDRKLNREELSKAWGFIAQNSVFKSCNPVRVNHAEQMGSHGLDYINWVLINLDKNQDLGVSYDEIKGQWENMRTDTLMSEAISIALSADGLLNLAPEEIKFTCINCCPAAGGNKTDVPAK